MSMKLLQFSVVNCPNFVRSPQAVPDFFDCNYALTPWSWTLGTSRNCWCQAGWQLYVCPLTWPPDLADSMCPLCCLLLGSFSLCFCLLDSYWVLPCCLSLTNLSVLYSFCLLLGFWLRLPRRSLSKAWITIENIANTCYLRYLLTYHQAFARNLVVRASTLQRGFHQLSLFLTLPFTFIQILHPLPWPPSTLY